MSDEIWFRLIDLFTIRIIHLSGIITFILGIAFFHLITFRRNFTKMLFDLFVLVQGTFRAISFPAPTDEASFNLFGGPSNAFFVPFIWVIVFHVLRVQVSITLWLSFVTGFTFVISSQKFRIKFNWLFLSIWLVTRCKRWTRNRLCAVIHKYFANPIQSHLRFMFFLFRCWPWGWNAFEWWM